MYYRLLAADPERQDELLHDFVRSLTADLDRLEALRRTRPPHTEGSDRG